MPKSWPDGPTTLRKIAAPVKAPVIPTEREADGEKPRFAADPVKTWPTLYLVPAAFNDTRTPLGSA